MKFKHFLIGAAVVVGFLAGINALNDDTAGSSGFGSGLEKDLAASLPSMLPPCYCVNSSGAEVLNVLEVKDLTIERQSTDGNFKTVDCTVELEGNDLSMTAYLNLICIKYDGGDWCVESCSERAEPKVVPKFCPPESSFQWNLQRYEGYQTLIKTNEYIDLENGQATYMYNVQDVYPYMRVSGGVSCTATFENAGMNYADDREVYWWRMSNGVPANIEWDVLGTWHLETNVSSGMPNIAEITLYGFGEENAGTSTYTYPAVDGFQYTGQYKFYEGGASCTVSGETPDEAMCVIKGYCSEIVITKEGVTAKINGKNCDIITKN